MQPAKEIQLGIESRFDFCIQLPRHSFHQAQQDLFASGAPSGSFARGIRQGCLFSGLRHLSLLRRWGHRRGGRRRGGRKRWIRRRRGLLRSASRCQGSRGFHFARSGDAQQLLVERRQQGLQLCAIIRMSAAVVGGIMCFELFSKESWKLVARWNSPSLGV